jgi:hypothetical protein
LSLYLSIVNTSSMYRQHIGTNPKHHTVSLFQFYTLILDKGGYSETSVAYVSISLHGVTYNNTVILMSCLKR